MKYLFTCLIAFLALLLPGCAPLETIATHSFGSGYFKYVPAKGESSKVYADVYDDSVAVYSLKAPDYKIPDTESVVCTKISNINKSDFLYGSRFTKTSIDFDLATVGVKLRPSYSGVPAQLNSNVNAALYVGARKDIYMVRSHKSALNKTNSFIRQFGYDAGFFAGLGITPVNPTVTKDNTSNEYDGVVFQKGIAAFVTLDHVSVGIAMGFDNLMGADSKTWIYNNKPWIGLILGIANF